MSKTGKGPMGIKLGQGRANRKGGRGGLSGNLMTTLGLELGTERRKGTFNFLCYGKAANLYSHVEWHNSNPYIVSSFSVHICQF